jgi:hypothetical protein
MFSGAIVWRGIIYTILMLIGKALCGVWLIRFSVPLRDKIIDAGNSTTSGVGALLRKLSLGRLVHQHKREQEKTGSTGAGSRNQGVPLREPQMSTTSPHPVVEKGKSPEKPLSLYPAGIMAFAMIARGEIGFLISSVAESNGIFSGSSASAPPDEASEIFLIVTWAIVLCTVIGPFCVGLLVRRVKKLEAKSAAAPVEGAKRDVLGVWGVS